MASISDVPVIIEGISDIPGIQIFRPGAEEYEKSIEHWFESSEQRSVVVVRPSHIQALSSLLQLLDDSHSLDFGLAIKGGGRTSCPGFSSTPDVHIDISHFNGIAYNSNENTVDVGAGCSWDGVYKFLADNHRNVNVVGGDGDQGVGVAGYLLGCGFSVKTNQFGLGIDNISRLEVVLPNGEVKVATAKSNQDLFWALKGGGNNFGVVTKFTLQSHPQDKIYAGRLSFSHDDFSRVTQAITDFNDEQSQNPSKKAAVMASYTYIATPDSAGVLGINSKASVLCFLDSPGPSSLFDKFLAIPSRKGDLKTMDWIDLWKDQPPAPKLRGQFGCIMVLKYTEKLLNEMAKEAEKSASKMLQNGGMEISIGARTLIDSIFDDSPSAAYPHSKGKPFGPLVTAFKWKGSKHDKFWIDEMKGVLDRLYTVALSESCTTPNAPVCPNHSLGDTPVSSIYQGNLDKLRELRRIYDTNKLMDHNGGFRIA